MPRLIFVNRLLRPDHSATSQILSDLAIHLAGARIGLRILTSQPKLSAGSLGEPLC
jgi:colanic acid biosynthesis glycosyl transferase WcaI